MTQPPARCQVLAGASLVVAIVLGVSGCATYTPLSLGDGHGAARVSDLAVSTARMPLPALARHRLDPSDGLDVTEVAMLAVANNPQLKIKRDELGIARAQAFAAGLLPDPQLSLGADFPIHSGPGLTKAYSVGLTEDVTALLTRSSRRAVARAQAGQVNLDLLWAEWQVVAQARLQFGQVLSLREQYARLETEQAALALVDHYVQTALRAGNLTYDTASAGLNAGADVRKRLADLTIQLHQAESDLHVLLGLAAQAPLDLTGDAYRTVPTSAAVDQALADLPRRRPDLLALQAGYRAQDTKLRAAILAQFPALTLGFNTARDTGAVYTNGFSIGISLPLFDRNRGNIAIETATRRRLKDEYAARLLTTRSDMQRLLADLAVLDRQQTAMGEHAAQLDTALTSAERAWQAGLIDWPTYLAIRSNALSADLELIAVRQERAKQTIALEALLGNTDFTDSAQVPTP